jgi:hypothetical protein
MPALPAGEGTPDDDSGLLTGRLSQGKGDCTELESGIIAHRERPRFPHSCSSPAASPITFRDRRWPPMADCWLKTPGSVLTDGCVDFGSTTVLAR